jgi:hypothetical protein
MKRLIFAVFALSIAAGCDKLGGSGKDEAKGAGSAASQPSAVAPPAVTFAGTYRAAWGDTVFTQSGSAVNATYPGGTLSCAAKESALDCSWKEGSASGKALLTRSADGTIEGTWGNGESVKDGGKWTFTPKK